MKPDIQLQPGDRVIFVKRTHKKHKDTLLQGKIISLDSKRASVRFSYYQQPNVFFTKNIWLKNIYFVYRENGNKVRIEGYGTQTGFLLY